MKQFTILAVILLLLCSNLALSWDFDFEYIELLPLSLQDENIEFNPEISYYFENQTLKFNVPENTTEMTAFKIILRSQYNILCTFKEDWSLNTTMEIDQSYSNNRKNHVDFYYKITLAEIPDIIINNKSIENPQTYDLSYEPKSSGIELSKDFNDLIPDFGKSYYSSGYALYEIELTIDVRYWNPDYDLTIRIENPVIYNVLKPPLWTDTTCFIMPNKNSFSSGETMDIFLEFYYGNESQIVDVYIVIYEEPNLFFFPEWLSKVQKATLFIPQYTMSSQFIKLATYEVDGLPIGKGSNRIMTIGIAPTGTLDFLNELELRHFSLK